MRDNPARMLLAALVFVLLPPAADAEPRRPTGRHDAVRVRPGMLAQSIEELAGQRVEVLNARAVGMFGPRVLIVDTAARLEGIRGQRDRVIVLIDGGSIWVEPELLVGSTLRVLGVARTLLGMQVSREVPWPDELDRARIERLEIRAAVLATSVQTPDGVELTDRKEGQSVREDGQAFSSVFACSSRRICPRLTNPSRWPWSTTGS